MWAKLFWKELRIADVILILLTIVCIYLSGTYFYNTPQKSSVYIYKDNMLHGSYPIDENKIINIDGHNTVEIKDGKVRMIHADCPDKRCMKQGFSNSMPIICLPNHLMIEIKENEEDKLLILQ